MIVNRRTFIVKRNCMEEIAELLRNSASTSPHSHPRRLYTSSIGPFDTIATEIEFENLQEYEEYWAEWFARPETAEFMEKWFELTESGGTNEIWDLEAFT